MTDKTAKARKNQKKELARIEKAKQMIKREEERKDMLAFLTFAGILILAVCSCLLIYDAATYNGEYYKFAFTGEGGHFKYRNYNVGPIGLSLICQLTGFVFTFVSSFLRGRRYLLNLLSAIFLPILSYAEAILGAKILFAIEGAIGKGSFDNLDFTGFSLFGSLYFTVISIPIMALIFKRNIRDTFDLCAVFGLILLAFTRLSCFVSGCCGSREFFINGRLVFLPVQFFDSMCALLLMFLCLRAEKRENHMLWRFKPYVILMMGYPICRFFLEFIRTNKPILLGLTIAQIHAILIFIIGLSFFVYDNVKLVRETKTAPDTQTL